MQKNERLQWLITRLSQPDYQIFLRQLANEACCSVKTIRRDLNYLINERHAPCFISNAMVIRDKTQHSVELQGHWLNESELKSLFALNQIIAQLGTSVLQTQIKPFQNKLEALFKNKQTGHTLSSKIKLIQIAERQVNNLVFQTVIEALSAQKQLKITFWQRAKNQQIKRTISPLQLVRYKDSWKLDAWCHLRKALRTFSLEAIQTIELLTLNAHSISKKHLTEHFESSYGIFAGQADKQATLLFSPYIARWVQFEQWHPKQIGTLNQKGEYLLKIPYHKDEELIQDILKHGHHVQVLAPSELRHKVQQIFNTALKHYLRKT